MATNTESARWKSAAKKVSKNTVSIFYSHLNPLNGGKQATGAASGFVIDAERGIIMTNKQTAGSGPFFGTATFVAGEEQVDLKSLWIDPIHDFGFLQYDPSKLKFAKPTGLTLYPQGVAVGKEVRMVENNRSEDVLIHRGVITKLIHGAHPGRGVNCFADSFYIQVSYSGTSITLGFPVIDINGRVVGLQGQASAGPSDCAVFPVDRALRAYNCIKAGEPITRGTIQTTFQYAPLHASSNIGVPERVERQLRDMKCKLKITGLLVVSHIVPKGPADGNLEVGDILLTVNGHMVVHHLPLEVCLDNNIDGTIKLKVLRKNKCHDVELQVQDLNKLTPKRYLSYSGGTFQDVPYSVARSYCLPACTGGVFFPQPNGPFAGTFAPHSLILAVNKQEVQNLDEFAEILKALPDRARVQFKWRPMNNMNAASFCCATVDRHWYRDMKMVEWDETTKEWNETTIGERVGPVAPTPVPARYRQMENAPSEKVSALGRTFVDVSCTMADVIEGVSTAQTFGTGFVIDKTNGYVLVPRMTVQHKMSTIELTFANTALISARLRYEHPTRGFSIVQYDPKHLSCDVEELTISPQEARQGEELTFFSFNQSRMPVCAKANMNSVSEIWYGLLPSCPQYRPVNMEAYSTDSVLASQCQSGVFVDDNLCVKAFKLPLGFMKFSGGAGNSRIVSYKHVLPILADLKEGKSPSVRFVPFTVCPIELSMAITMGVPPEWVQKVVSETTARQNLLLVNKLLANAECEVKQGDIILTVNGKLTTRVNDLDCQFGSESLTLEVIRNGKVKTVTVKTDTDQGTCRVVRFAGATLHSPHLAARQEFTTLPSGVYISGTMHGSPASMYNLKPVTFIIELDGKPTPDLDTFIEVAKSIPDNKFVSVKSKYQCRERESVVQVRKWDKFFPMVEYVYRGSLSDNEDGLEWDMIEHQSAPCVEGNADGALTGAGGVESNEAGDQDDAGVEPLVLLAPDMHVFHQTHDQ